MWFLLSRSGTEFGLVLLEVDLILASWPDRPLTLF